MSFRALPTQTVIQPLRTLSMVTIYICPENEPAQAAAEVLRFWVTPSTSLDELKANVCACLNYKPKKSVLLDDFGAEWSPKNVIADTQKFSNQRLRLVQQTPDKASEVKSQGTLSDVASSEERGLRYASGRKPARLELFLHMAFIIVLFLRISPPWTNFVAYEFHDSIRGIFAVETKIAPHMPFPVAAAQPLSESDMCNWFRFSLTSSLFAPVPAGSMLTGNIDTTNRLVGGLSASIVTEPFVPDRCFLPTVHAECNPKDVASSPNESLPREVLSIPIRAKHYQTGWMANQSVLMAEDVHNFSKAVCGGESSHGYITDRVLRELSLYALVYNHNWDTYAKVDIRFARQPGGSFETDYIIRPFSLHGDGHAPSLFLFDVKSIFSDMELYLAVVSYTLVFFRMRTEFNVASEIYKSSGSLWPYFSNVFTVMELINLSLFYTVVALDVTFAINQWRHSILDQITLLGGNQGAGIHETLGPLLDEVDLLSSASHSVNAFLVLTSVLITTRFFELLPRRSVWFLTGTAVSSQMRFLSLLMASMFCLSAAFAIMGEQLVGTDIEALSTPWRAFTITLCTFLGGSGAPLKALSVPGLIWYYLLQYLSITLASPFFLAVISDAYGRRSVTWSEARERQNRRIAESILSGKTQKLPGE